MLKTNAITTTRHSYMSGENDNLLSLMFYRKLQAVMFHIQITTFVICCHTKIRISKYEGYPESTGPFWISRDPIAWPWCSLAARQRRLYCASVNSHCPVGLVSRQWEAVDWTCILCDRHVHKSAPFQRRFLLWGKATSRREPNLGCRGADRPEWCDALPEKNCTRVVEWAGTWTRWSWSARSVILNSTVTQWTSSENGASLPTD